MNGGRGPKRKGDAFERELVNKARSIGLDAERARMSDGRAIGEASSVDIKIGTERLQCKRKGTLPEWAAIPPGCDAVTFRQDKGAAMILMPFDDWLTLIQIVTCLAEEQ